MRWSEAGYLSRIVLAHAPRQASVSLILDVRQRNEYRNHRHLRNGQRCTQRAVACGCVLRFTSSHAEEISNRRYGHQQPDSIVDLPDIRIDRNWRDVVRNDGTAKHRGRSIKIHRNAIFLFRIFMHRATDYLRVYTKRFSIRLVVSPERIRI